MSENIDHIEPLSDTERTALAMLRSGASWQDASTATGISWAKEAQAFISWRDAIWLYVYGELAKVQSRERQQPSVSELAAELPEFTP